MSKTLCSSDTSLLLPHSIQGRTHPRFDLGLAIRRSHHLHDNEAIRLYEVVPTVKIASTSFF